MRSFLSTTSRPRRRLLTATLVATTALTLTACGQADDTSAGAASEGAEAAAPAEFDPDEEYTLRYAWWGSDVRHGLNQQVIDAFTEKYPNVTIVPDFTDWDGYWDKLATGVAGGDTPDVIMQEERYLRDYGERGVIADLNDFDIATDKIEEEILSVGEFDGGQYGIPTGINVYSVLANPAVFEKAGVEMPDDETWTWEEYQDIAIEIGASGQSVFGMQDHGYNEPGFMVFARQRGEELYTPEGELGYQDETLVDWWNIALNLQKNGGQPSASETVELETGGPEQSLLGTNRGAMGAWWTNQLTAIQTAAGTDLELLRWPGETEGERTGMYFKPSMYISMSADTEAPAAAAMFIDFMVNDPEAGRILLSDRGLPANTDVRTAVEAQFTAGDVKAAEFMKDLEDEIVDGVPTPPVGAGEVAAILARINSEVLFERMTPEEGAQQFRAEVEQAIG
ncbi:ABC transporter substrate-binding protein [Cellulomonas aerilata]|uniref:Sugar ABC transporter substrate-binding protein n=1 Tax=Cellulomonas aerilata TaxID=515326 RepID=A0A512DCQ1_9CELL|nr:extracellular solute-binding protein [Cellulomonas aerilata]GEO34235.1 sugar ABC transporter substrate-binding protein [Cellulomonas aerilata]